MPAVDLKHIINNKWPKKKFDSSIKMFTQTNESNYLHNYNVIMILHQLYVIINNQLYLSSKESTQLISYSQLLMVYCYTVANCHKIYSSVSYHHHENHWLLLNSCMSYSQLYEEPIIPPQGMHSWCTSVTQQLLLQLAVQPIKTTPVD